MHSEQNFAGGLTLAFFDSDQYETVAGDDHEKAMITVRNLMRLLMMGWQDHWHDWISWSLLQAIFIKRDHQLTKAMRLAFQEGFNTIYQQLAQQTLTPLQHNQALLYISNCLAVLPFADITPHESFAIPQWLDNRWQLIDYRVVPIELTPTFGVKKLFLADNDRVFAFGLEPIIANNAQSHLIFMGTTYPAGQGFHSHINTDLEGFESAGKHLYRSGHARLTAWLDAQPNKTHVCGMSLGGSLALLLAIDQGEKLSRVDALNPPGLYEPWRKSRFDHWQELTEKPAVYIQKQGRDPVSIFGNWKPDWHVLQVEAPANKRGPNGLADHALNYAGFAQTSFIEVDAQDDNRQRKTRNFFLFVVLRSIVYFGLMVPYTYVILPLWRYLFSHKLQIVLTAVFFILLGLPVMTANFVMPLLPTMLIILTAIITAIANAYLLTNIIWFFNDNFNYRKTSDFTKFTVWFAQQSVVIKAIFISSSLLATGVAIAGLVITSFVLPPLSPVIIPLLTLSLLGLPLFIAIGVSIKYVVDTVLGKALVKDARFLDPTLPRNETLDIYTQSLTAEFNVQDISHYYWVKRQHKNFLPQDKNAKRATYNGLSKYEVLQASHTESERDKSVMVTTTKAKLYDMKKTIQAVNRWGINRVMNERRETNMPHSGVNPVRSV